MLSSQRPCGCLELSGMGPQTWDSSSEAGVVLRPFPVDLATLGRAVPQRLWPVRKAEGLGAL